MLKANLKQIVFTFLILFIILIFWYLDFYKCFSIDFLRENMVLLNELIASHYYWSLFIYIVLFITAMALCFPGLSILSMAGGMLFGIYYGFFLALIAATIGAVLLFLSSRYFLGNWIQVRYAYPLQKFNHEIAIHGHYYLLLLRLIAIFPFSLVNLFSGLTVLSIKKYILVTFIGLIPISFVYALLGAQLNHAFSSQKILGESWVIILFFLFKMALVPSIFNQFRRLKVIFATQNNS